MSKWGSLAASDKPFRVEIVDMETGEVIRDKDGKASYIDVHAVDGARGRKYDKDERSAAIERARKGRQADKIADPMEANIAKCAALTADWYLVDPATGEPLDVPCTVESAMELYSLPLTAWLFVQPWSAANNHANFTKRSADNSTSTQSGTSETAAS